MHGAATEQQVDPVKAAWADTARELVSVASAARQQKEVVQQEEESAPKDNHLEAEYKRILAQAMKLPVESGAGALIRARLADLEKEIEKGGDPGGIAAQLAEKEKQIAKALSAKAPSTSEQEAHQKWIKETFVPKREQFARECEAVTAKLVQAAKARIQKDALGEEAAKSELAFISAPIVETRNAFQQEFTLEGSGDGAALLKQFQSRLASVEKQVAALITGDGFAKLVGGEVNAAKDKEAQLKLQAEQEELEAAMKTARSALAQLEDLGSAQGPVLRKELEAVKKKEDAVLVQGRIEAAVKDHKEKNEAVVKAHEGSVGKISESVDAVAKKLESADAKKSLQSMKEELERTKALAMTGNAAAAQAAERISKQIENLATAAADKNSAFNQLFAGVKTQKDALDEANLKKYFVKEQKELSDALTKLSAGVDPLELAASEQSFNDLKAKVTALTVKTQKLVDWQQVVEANLKTIDHMMQGFRDTLKDRNSAFVKALGSLSDRLFGDETKISLLEKEVRDGYQKPGVDMAKMDALKGELVRRAFDLQAIWETAYRSGNTEPLQTALNLEASAAEADLQQKKEAEAKKKEERAKWDKDYKAFQGKVDELKKKVEANLGPKDELATVVSLGDAANKMAENGDVPGARDKLKLAEKRHDDLDAAPGGVTMRSAGQLGMAPGKWLMAIGDLKTKLEELKTAIDKDAELSEESRSAAKGKIDTIPALFQAGVFDKDIEDILQAKDLEVRKQAREKILQQVRQYRALMQANPVLQLARRNPFKVKQVTTPIQNSLASIELNTLRAVKGAE